MAGKANVTPVTYSQSSNKKQQQPFYKNSDLVWVRPDGRGFHQCRPAFFRTGAVNTASGSAYAELGNTKVVVSVFGPRESKKAMMYSDIGRLNCNVSHTTFATSVRGQGSDHKEFSSILTKPWKVRSDWKLSQNPLLISLRWFWNLVEVPGDFPVLISCASLALADAEIMFHDLVAAVSVSSLGSNLVIDPGNEEESYQDGSLLITCIPSLYEVTQLTITGEWSTSRISEAMELCLDACTKLGKVMRSCLKEAASTTG